VAALLKKKITEATLTRATYNAEGRTLTLNGVRDALIPGAAVGDGELEAFLIFLCSASQEL
jgi:hypothetical protein